MEDRQGPPRLPGNSGRRDVQVASEIDRHGAVEDRPQCVVIERARCRHALQELVRSVAIGEDVRMSARRKRGAVLRLLRGEDLELVSRELGVTAAELSGWRDAFLAGGEASLKTRPADDRDVEIARLKGKVGDLTMSNELLEAKIGRLEGSRPLARRRSRR